MSVISMKQLLEAGVHFGHQTRRWNPKMAPYIYTERNGIYIIDLQKSVGMVDDAYKAVSDIAAEGGTILFVIKRGIVCPCGNPDEPDASVVSCRQSNYFVQRPGYGSRTYRF